MQLGWDSRGAAHTFLDQLTEWERRIQEYEGESLETFSDGMKIAVLASHAPESIRNVVIVHCGRTCQCFLSSAESSTRMGRGVESEPSSANVTSDVDGFR